MKPNATRVVLAALCLATAGTIAADPLDLTKQSKEMDPALRDNGITYTVQCPDGATAAEDCKVDKETYVGWRSYSANCLACHGGSGMGSTFAPSLQDRFNAHVDHERFDYVLHNGYVGKMGAMPSFATNTAVLKDVDAIYRYLRARADGALPPGRPAKLPK
jgi:cytochrome c5